MTKKQIRAAFKTADRDWTTIGSYICILCGETIKDWPVADFDVESTGLICHLRCWERRKG